MRGTPRGRDGTVDGPTRRLVFCARGR